MKRYFSIVLLILVIFCSFESFGEGHVLSESKTNKEVYRFSNVDPFGFISDGGCFGENINYFLEEMQEDVDYIKDESDTETIYHINDYFYYMDFPEDNAYAAFGTEPDSSLINRVMYYFSCSAEKSDLLSDSVNNIYKEIEAVCGKPDLRFYPLSSYENSREITRNIMLFHLSNRTEGDYIITWELRDMTIALVLAVGGESAFDIGYLSFEANKLQPGETIETLANYNLYSDSITGATFFIGNKWNETTTYSGDDGLEYTEFTHVNNKYARITFCRADMWTQYNAKRNNLLDNLGVSRSMFNMYNIYSKEELAANMNCDIDDIATLTYAGHDYYYIYLAESDESFFMTLVNGYYYAFMLHSSAHAYYEDFDFLLNNISYIE